MSPNVIISQKLLMIPDATLYLFGVLTSSIHMAWVRIAAGRLEMRYSYTPAVYNNFPWLKPTDKQRRAIELCAQKILDVRANYPDATLADLYDQLSMPKDLRDAHRSNDKAVASAYGLENILDDESKITAEMLKMYNQHSQGE